MKRIIALAAVILLLLSGCSGRAANTTTLSTTVPPEIISNYIGEGLTTQLRALADNAIYISREVFSYGSLPCGDTPVSVDGKDYYPVNSDKFRSYAELEAYISNIFTPEASKALLSEGKYIESDGIFLCNKSAYTVNEKVDLNNYTVSVNKVSDNEIAISVTPKGTAVSFTLIAEKSGGDWRIEAPLDISQLTGGKAK